MSDDTKATDVDAMDEAVRAFFEHNPHLIPRPKSEGPDEFTGDEAWKNLSAEEIANLAWSTPPKDER